MQTRIRVRGDWLPDDHPGYEAERIDERRWNGWAVPHFRREVVEQIAADTQRLAKELGETAAFDIITVENDHEVRLDAVDMGVVGFTEYIEADADGTYAIGGWSWCWYETDHYDA